MASRGKQETEQLKQNLEEQLFRLLTQLQDIEENKEDLGDDYASMHADTVQQLKEQQATLNKLVHGNVTLVDALGSMQLAIQAAVSSAFKTPEVIKMFAKKDSGSLRQRLTALQTSMKLGKVGREAYTQQAVEILSALAKLGEPLSGDEQAFLHEHRTQAIADFDKADAADLGTQAKAQLLTKAANDVAKAQK